jgi:flagella basal body P-ring formation protein FlgA
MVLLLALGIVAPPAVQAAIERAVVERMGEVRVVMRSVSVFGVQTSVGDDDLVATVEPGARLGQPMRFVLTTRGKRAGSAVATLAISGEAVRARRSIARGDDVGSGDIETASMELKNVLLRRMPVATDIVGTRARRDIAAGELVTNALVVVPPAVRSGDVVRVVVTMGSVQVSGDGRASGSGQVGDRIRVLTASSRKPLNARITGRGAVEIVQ